MFDDKIIEMMKELEELQAEQKELDECGDPEDRLEMDQKVADLETELFKARMRETGESC
jgi:hypothetical protein